ncbi:MAG: ABC transporter permease [Brevirhabdus sp.]
MSDYIALSYWDLALASVFLLLNGAISMALGLGLEKRLGIAALRMFVQLSLVGVVLKTLFGMTSALAVLGVLAFMILFAGREVLARQKSRVAGWAGYAIGTGAMAAASLVVALVALTLVIRPEPVWSAQYALPLVGMILGNAMTGISLALDTFHRAIRRENRAIEAQLLLGAPRLVAMRPFLRDALRAGLMPTINSMAATGVVFLPGMMSGQILSGVDPQEAVKYQILVMLLISGSTGLGVLAAVGGSALRLSDERHRLRPERLVTRKE